MAKKKKRHCLLFLIAILSLIVYVVSSCEEDNNPCDGVICENNGTCTNGVCDCPEGYLGDNCESFDLTKIQELLDAERSPNELFDGGVPLDSLYGKKYQGGIIFFVNIKPEDYPFFNGNGMVTTEVDYGNFTPWGCFIATGATGSEVGQGHTNTQTIIGAMCNPAPASTILCNDLVLNGYDDWFLPSIEEVNLIYNNLHLKGHNNFLGNIQRYQSSTEVNANEFMLRFFWRDQVTPISKISGDDIRPVRTF